MKKPRVIELGNIVHTGNWSNPQRGRIYSPTGVAPCCNTVGGGQAPTLLATDYKSPPIVIEIYEQQETRDIPKK